MTRRSLRNKNVLAVISFIVLLHAAQGVPIHGVSDGAERQRQRDLVVAVKSKVCLFVRSCACVLAGYTRELGMDWIASC